MLDGPRTPDITQLTLICEDGTTITDSQTKAEALARRYQIPLGDHPIRDKKRCKLLKERRTAQEKINPRGKDHAPFTIEEAIIARKELSNGKAPGLTGIGKTELEMGGRMMDELVRTLAEKIAIKGPWPSCLKKGANCPIPKNKETNETISIEETRPISLLEVLDKWLEKMFFNRIKPYVHYHETQAGYSLSCDHHLTLVSDFIEKNSQAGKYLIAIFTDISKAFDSVPLNELIEAIWTSNMPVAYKWVLQSFVSDRSFLVKIRNKNGDISLSKLRKLIYGTPQGSILGPLLWNLFFEPLLHKLEEVKKQEEEKSTSTEIKQIHKQTKNQRKAEAMKRIEQEDPSNEPTSSLTLIKEGNELTPDSSTPQPLPNINILLEDREELDMGPNSSSKTPQVTSVKTASQETDIHPTDEHKPTQETQNRPVDQLDVCFADDLTLLAASDNPKDAEALLNKKLAVFEAFLKERGMKAAAHKIKAMCIDKLERGYKPNVQFKGNTVNVVEEHRFLGIIYDKNFTFEKHYEFIFEALNKRIRTIACLKSARWGPTIQTFKVLHRCYVESRIRYGILAWYPHLSQILRAKLDVTLRRSLRIVMGLSYRTNIQILAAESNLDSVRDIAQKAALSFYTQINPTTETPTTMAARKFKQSKPIWMNLLEGRSGIPETIWSGCIQETFTKKLIQLDTNKIINLDTLKSKKETEIIEDRYSYILYTDASVVPTKCRTGKITNQINEGEAAAAYIWYKKDANGEWKVEAKGSAGIGNNHSSYSAEAVAIRLGLENAPTNLTATPKPHPLSIKPTSTQRRPKNSDDPVSRLTPEESTRQSYQIGIFTDSLSNLMTIHGQLATTKDQQILMTTIRDFPAKITMHHVKSHAENSKNNDVDALCSMNINKPNRPQLLPTSRLSHRQDH